MALTTIAAQECPRRMRKEGSSAESQLGLPEYHSRGYFEKIASALLALFILAAMAGVFGNGPLSDSVVTSKDGQLRVEYQRFCRRDAQQVLDVTLPTRPEVKQVELTLSSEYLRRMQVMEIFPTPLEATSEDGRSLRFATDGDGKPLRVRFNLKPRFSGWQEADITAAHGSVHFKQFVYP